MVLLLRGVRTFQAYPSRAGRRHAGRQRVRTDSAARAGANVGGRAPPHLDRLSARLCLSLRALLLRRRPSPLPPLRLKATEGALIRFQALVEALVEALVQVLEEEEEKGRDRRGRGATPRTGPASPLPGSACGEPQQDENVPGNCSGKAFLPNAAPGNESCRQKPGSLSPKQLSGKGTRPCPTPPHPLPRLKAAEGAPIHFQAEKGQTEKGVGGESGPEERRGPEKETERKSPAESAGAYGPASAVGAKRVHRRADGMGVGGYLVNGALGEQPAEAAAVHARP